MNKSMVIHVSLFLLFIDLYVFTQLHW